MKRENHDELANYCGSHTSVFHSPLVAGSIPDTVGEQKLQVRTILLESIEFCFTAGKPKGLYYYRRSEVRFLFSGNTSEDIILV